MRPEPIAPKAGQESVWSYPRPPRIDASTRKVRVVHAGVVIAESQRALRVLETSHPPTWYLPPDDIRLELLRDAVGASYCEWKGAARYFDLDVAGARTSKVAWSYPSPLPAFVALRDYIAFDASRVDACFVDDERVVPQPGGFYAGWITSDVVGPFKGEPGSMGW